MIQAFKPIAVLMTLAVAATVAAPVKVKPALTLEGAKLVAQAAQAEAERLGVGGAIAVVDDGGNVVYFARRDNTFTASPPISIGKARTAALFRKPTKVFEDAINQGRTAMTALADFTPLQGGIPIVYKGEVVGGIGVSGASSAQQDEDIAIVGANALSGGGESEVQP